MRIARWLMPSIGEVLFLAILLNILVQGNALLGDPDTGMHIRAGDYILETLSIPKTDIFSHTMLGQPWIAHEWLSEVLFSLIHRIAGLKGLVVTTALVISATFMVLFRLLLARQVSLLLAVMMTILAADTSSIHWLVRPHVISMFLTTVWYFLLDSHQRSRNRVYLYPLPFLMALWVNLHVAYFTGLVLIGIYLLGNWCDFLFCPQWNDRKKHKQLMAALGSAGAVCLGAVLLNPNGYKILFLPFQFLNSEYILNHISEMVSPSFHGFSFFELYLLLTVVVLCLSPKKLGFIEIGLLVFYIHMALFAGRFIPIFAVIAAPIIGQQIQSLLTQDSAPLGFSGVLRLIADKFLALSGRMQLLSAVFKKHLMAMGVLVALWILLLNGGRVGERTVLDYQFDNAAFPVEAADFIKANRFTGNMYNSYGFGGYFIYRFYPDPNDRVFMDGRAVDLYGEEFFEKTFSAVDGLQPGWKAVLEQYHVNWIVYQTNSTLSRVLFESPDWVLIHVDKVAAIFVKKIPENQPLIKRYPDIHLLPSNP